ncbi:MAG: hypothetical protein GF409_06260 [Candidatus Omnitrophica bacterium]|nr:hypothetical protein [Candidatus Omnitrophota bacterium]
MKKLSFILIILFLSGTVFADNAPQNVYSCRPAGTWRGEKFVFHPKPMNLRKFKYVNINIVDGDGKRSPSYAECVGKTVTVTDIDIQDEDNFTVRFRSDDGTLYEAVTNTGCIEGLIPLRDIENAREEFSGSKLWHLKENMLRYEEATDSYEPVYAPKYSSLTVVDVEPGWSNTTPVRFILENEYEQKGYVELNLSGTNVPRSMRSRNRLWDNFSRDDPEKWDEMTKNYLERHMIQPGMTSGQVQMSWGSPAKIEDLSGGRQKWIYPYGDCLYFKGGRLEKISGE